MDPAPMEDIMVVSEIGEEWSPKIAPAKTAAEVVNKSWLLPGSRL